MVSEQQTLDMLKELIENIKKYEDAVFYRKEDMFTRGHWGRLWNDCRKAERYVEKREYAIERQKNFEAEYEGSSDTEEDDGQPDLMTEYQDLYSGEGLDDDTERL